MMSHEEPYKQLQDETPTNPVGPGAFPQPVAYAGGNGPYVPPVPTFEADKQLVDNVRRTKKLATVEMALSCLLLVFGMISTGLAAKIGYYVTPCILGTSIWAPVLGIITAGLGLGALRYGNYSRKCLLVSHFVMCIISAVASGILVIHTSVCLASSSWIIGYMDRPDDYYGYYTPRGLPEALIAFEAFILPGALAHMIASIVSTAFICRYWCGNKGTAGTTIVYIPSQAGGGNGPMQAISVPAGAQVVFVPSNGAVGSASATVQVAP